MFQIELIIPVFKMIFIVISGIIGLSFLIGFHELGHFLMCKLFNIETPSFSIGFGPHLFSRKIGNTIFSLSAIPLGGYVEIAGLAEVGQGSQESAFSEDKASFTAKPFWQKLLVMLGGIIFNLGFAYATFIALFYIGAPKTTLISQNNPIPIIASILPGSAAEKAGLKEGDILLKINNVEIGKSAHTIRSIIDSLESNNTSITIERNTDIIEYQITLDEKKIQEKSVKQLGISYELSIPVAHSFLEAIKMGITEANHWVQQTAKSFSLCCRKLNTIKEMAGPLMIMSIMTKAAMDGFSFFLVILAIISINLAILNLIPLPILDGGQLFLCLIETIIQRPLPHKIRMVIHLVTWALFIVLFLVLSIQDVSRIITPYISSITKFLNIK